MKDKCTNEFFPFDFFSSVVRMEMEMETKSDQGFAEDEVEVEVEDEEQGKMAQRLIDGVLEKHGKSSDTDSYMNEDKVKSSLTPTPWYPY